jgi:large subunit ribosomal protein L18
MNGDRVLVSAASQELVRDYGWKAPCGNMPAAYLTGFLAGLKAKRKGIEKAVLDAGVKKPVKGSKIYAGLKGLLDAGVEVSCDSDVLPSEERITGEHVAEHWRSLTDPEQRSRFFSQYLAKGLTPEDLAKHFQDVKENIRKAFSQG